MSFFQTLRLSLVSVLLAAGLPPCLQAGTTAEFVRGLYQDKNAQHFYFNEPALKLYTPQIQELIKKAIQADFAHTAKQPDEKPPFADYSLILPGPDAYAGVRLYNSDGDTATRASVIVEFIYPEKDQVPSAFLQLRVERAKDQWQIAGIRRLDPAGGNPDPVQELKSALEKTDVKKP